MGICLNGLRKKIETYLFFWVIKDQLMLTYERGTGNRLPLYITTTTKIPVRICKKMRFLKLLEVGSCDEGQKRCISSVTGISLLQTYLSLR